MLSVALALLADTVLIAIVLSRLSGTHQRWRDVGSAAVLGAIGFEVLKLAGTYLIGRTTQNPLYATFGFVVGLLIWINLVSQLLMYVAAWAATGATGAVGRFAGRCANQHAVAVSREAASRWRRSSAARSGPPVAASLSRRRPATVGAVRAAWPRPSRRSLAQQYARAQHHDQRRAATGTQPQRQAAPAAGAGRAVVFAAPPRRDARATPGLRA